MPTCDNLQVTTSSGDLALQVTGSGPTIVLLHANPGSSKDFDGVSDQLAAEHRVVAVDWPGYGLSPAPALDSFRGAMTYRDVLVELLDELTDGHRWGPFVLVGSSVGGFAALSAAAARPDLVAGLVLVAPGGFTAQNPLTRLACRSLGRSSIARFTAKPLARLYLRCRNETTRRTLAEAGSIATNPARREVYCAIWHSFAEPEHDLRDLAPPPVPSLLTWGRFDPVLPAFTDGRRAAKALDLQLHRYPTGHEPYAELPDRWIGDVKPFLAAIPAAGGRWLPAGNDGGG